MPTTLAAQRRRLGIYYTSDDVADYMARAAIIPHLLNHSGWPGDGAQLITDNSDLPQTALDWLATLTDGDRLRLFWDRLRSLTVLDPTCGTGAFLLAALRVLRPLYEAGHAALRRYHLDPGLAPTAFTRHIVSHNLYGVDLCPLAVAACRATLQALCTDSEQPLPDVNLHVGNALVEDAAFSWQRAFPAILRRGGFAIVLGNPPYLEIREVPYQPSGFTLATTGTIHALVVEQALRLLHPEGALSLIVPLALVATQRMKPAQEMLEARRSVWYANFSWRPAKLFADVNRALTIVTSHPGARTYATGYLQWRARERAVLLEQIRYTEVPRPRDTFWIPKLSCILERTLLARWLALPGRVANYVTNADTANARIYYRCDGGLYWKVFTDFPPAFSVQGRMTPSTRQTSVCARRSAWVLPLIGALSSDLFWWWYIVSSNARHLNPSDLHGFPLPASVLEDRAITDTARAYLDDIVQHSCMKTRQQRQTGTTCTQSFVIRRSRPLIERLDDLLAPHYGLSAAELHFIKNFDLGFRLGKTREPD